MCPSLRGATPPAALEARPYLRESGSRQRGRTTGGCGSGWRRVRGLAAFRRSPGGSGGPVMSVLDDIVAGVREDLARRQSATPEAELRARLLDVPPALDPMPA